MWLSTARGLKETHTVLYTQRHLNRLESSWNSMLQPDIKKTGLLQGKKRDRSFLSARDRKDLNSQDLLLQKALQDTYIHTIRRAKKSRSKCSFS